MEAIVHQALGNIFLGDTGLSLERAQVKYAFVGHALITPAVQHGKGAGQLLCNVVG
ncbi:hypothetical protein D3C80_2207080 [compost metagenome]